MKPTIYLTLTDDWELRGNGSGDIEEVQFRPMRELMAAYARRGVRGTFNAEVMQQLTFRRLQGAHPELKPLADRWDEHARAALRRGHDVQLHIHPQWSRARYEGGRWRLDGDWSILNYEPAEARAMIAAGKDYLENLLRPVDASYRCATFRAGALCIAPSPFILGLLAEFGLTLDVSMAGGLRFDTPHLKLDYTRCEEDFLPFYPRMDDARRVSDKEEPIVCAPIFNFRGSRRQFARQLSAKVWQKAARKLSTAKGDGNAAGSADEYARQEWADAGAASPLARVYEKAVRPLVEGKRLLADIGQLSYPQLREMLNAVRRRARASGLPRVPVVLTNHTKNVADFAPIERFLGDAAASDDVKFLTLTELAEKLRAGEFHIKKSA